VAKSKRFLEGTISWEGRNVTYRVPQNLTKVDQTSELASLKEQHPLFFDCTDIHIDHQYLVFIYHIEKEYLPLSRARKQSKLPRLAIAENLLNLQVLEHNGFVSFLYPENIYFKQQQEVKVLYRGNRGLMNPSNEHVLFHVQCLIVDLFTKLPFYQLKKNGFNSYYEEASDFVKHVIDAPHFDNLYIAIVRERERLQEQYVQKMNEKKRIAATPQKKLLLTAGSLIVALGILGGSLAWGESLDDPQLANANENLQTMEQKIDKRDHLLSLYRLAFQEDYKGIIASLEDGKKLGKEEERLLFSALLETEQYNQAAAMTSDHSVLKYLLDHDPEAIIKLDSDDPTIHFEQAYQQQEYKTVISLKDKASLTDRRKEMLADAYINLKKYDKAYSIAKELNHKDLAIAVKKKQMNQIKAKEKDKEKREKAIDQLKKDIKQIEKGKF
jgi:hypothetical protein